MDNPFIIGKNVYLRPLELEDSACYVKWLNDGEITRSLAYMRRFPINMVREKEFIQEKYKSTNDIILGIVFKPDNNLIGSIGLHEINPVNRTAVLGILIGDKNYHNKGLGTEVVKLMLNYGFNTLNLHRISLEVNADNTGAIRCYEKSGFKLEGRLREDYYFDGKYKDKLIMGILKSEQPVSD